MSSIMHVTTYGGGVLKGMPHTFENPVMKSLGQGKRILPLEYIPISNVFVSLTI